MLTGNGRHRRPRQAPALLVAAGVAGSAIAIPLLGAGGASAADGNTWDQVAKCETDGSWSANNGDGYYGGLKLSQENWEKYGGLDYATSPDLASRNQQIAVAEKVLDDQGVGVWGTCGLLNGLSQDSASDDVDTGVGSGTPSASEESDSDESSDSSTSSGLSNSSGSSDSSTGSTADPTASPSASTEADESAKSDDSDSGAEKSQPSDSPSTAPANSGESDNSWQEGGSSALVDTGALSAAEEGTVEEGTGTGRHRGASADEGSYTVRAGDTLASIADSLDLDGGWRRLYTENKQVIGADPSSIEPGQTLVLGSE
ncbi:LysM peptidoglycan-binding domain-containing protein [Streptomyces sp. S3(2020)]|uniref:LysM peptidoglycan-binding domain-containing protein n=1 Tax=Streptomyces sp. S3(2020) TaxID=2732044 RepID=UPI0014883875|nr:transglycosylase family protein [Streptomyces sp. S3(2020)]NNN30315.1 LysM peptidoglycan-binding domain-containing protein [Streptomyces sp. S3(2020)]